MQVFRRAARDLGEADSLKEFARLAPLVAKDVRDALVELGGRLDQKYAEVKALAEITEYINSGMFFDEVLDHVFETFGTLIPYDRIGVAIVDRDHMGDLWIRSQWNRARYEPVVLKKGYAMMMERSSLKDVFASGRPRILNDLETYLREHPGSTATRAILKEGIRSSLTCPLLARGKVTGFIFFSSRTPNVYRDQHVELFLQLAGELALTLEKSRSYEELCRRNDFMREMFGRYMTTEIAEMVLKDESPLALGGQRRKVTVLMCDLRDFTPMSETLPPEQLVHSLNAYLGTMTAVIMKYGGSIDNFIGDAIMAVFGVPAAKPDDAGRAVACAIEMQNTIPSVNAQLATAELPALCMGIGLNTGEVVAGNIGSELRMKYSVIGRPVNLAARIESFATPGQILASEATFNEVRDVVHIDGKLSVKMKGLRQAVPIYDIVGIGRPFDLRKQT